MRTVNRNEITDPNCRAILDIETHHDHEIIEGEEGVFRWKPNHVVIELVKEMDLDNIMWLFQQLGLNANSEITRKLYRNLGYSLHAYWKLFYTEGSNRQAKEYKPQPEITTIESLLILEPDFLLDVKSILDSRSQQKCFYKAAQASAEFSAQLIKSANNNEAKIDKVLLEKATDATIQAFMIQSLFIDSDKKEMVRRSIEINEY